MFCVQKKSNRILVNFFYTATSMNRDFRVGVGVGLQKNRSKRKVEEEVRVPREYKS